MSRPLRVPIFGRTLSVRTEPTAGTEDAGYPAGFPPPAQHWNWLHGTTGDWVEYLDKSTPRFRDIYHDSGEPDRVSPTRLGFTVGGPLVQTPLTGGVYIIRRERCDASAIGTDAPTFTFAASTTNFVWMRPRIDTSRSAYPEVAVTQLAVPPGVAYKLVYQNTTGVATVLTETEPVTVRVGMHYGTNQSVFMSGVRITPLAGFGGTTLFIQGRASMAPAVFIASEGGATNTLLQIAAEGEQTSIDLSAEGDNIPAVRTSVLIGGIGYQAFSTSTQSVGFEADMGFAGFPLSIIPTVGGEVPHVAGPHQDKFRLYVNHVPGVGGGLRWRDAAGSGRLWIPWASPGGQVLTHQRNADSGAIAGGGATTLITMAGITFRQNHRYLIRVECEANAGITWAGTVATTIAVMGVADPLWNARQHRPLPLGINAPWLYTTIVYTHAGVDTVAGTIALSILHGASVSSVNYLAPRITLEGALFP